MCSGELWGGRRKERKGGKSWRVERDEDGTEEGSREEERNEVEGRGMKVEEQTDGTELG